MKPREWYLLDAKLQQFIGGISQEVGIAFTQIPEPKDLTGKVTFLVELSAYQELQKKLDIAVEALKTLDAGYGGMFGSDTIPYEKEAIELAPKIVTEALKKIKE